MTRNRRSPLLILAALTALLLSSSCSVLIGNVKPVEEKSAEYGVLNLNQANPDWLKIDPAKAEEAQNATQITSTEVSDVAFQSRRSGSIISLNSACRSHMEDPPQDLKTLTNLLFLGMTDMTQRDERGLIVENTPALETIVKGRLGGEVMMLKTVVLRRGPCIYDLVYMARPRNFPSHTADFDRFVASLRLK